MKKFILMFVLIFGLFEQYPAVCERSALWDENQIRLSGCWEEDIVSVAQSLVGYQMSSGETDGDAEDRDWTARFVSFCAGYADIPLELTAGTVADLRRSGIRYRSYHTARNHQPEKGDIFFAREESRGEEAAYCGIVEQVTQTVIYTIEGDENERIIRRVYFRDDPLIYGYISIWDLMRADGIIVIEENLPALEPIAEEAAEKRNGGQKLQPASKEDEYFFLLNPAS